MNTLYHKVFLTGIMGAGKSYWAKHLSAFFGISYYDTDEMIETSSGKSIAQIFSEEGEARFRELEYALLRETNWPETAIISCGGGMPCFFDNMEYMLEKGIVLWLNPSTDIIVKRLLDAKVQRPLLASIHSSQELEDRIKGLLKERSIFYSKANLWVNEEDTIEQIAEKLTLIKK